MHKYLDINTIFKILFIFILIIAINTSSFAQSVIEVVDPADADVILLSVDKKEDADIVVYKTNKLSECKKWDCMWLFKKWGFSDLSIFIYTDIKDTAEYVDEDLKYKIQGKVYFTQNIQERGYKDPYFTIEGLIRKSSLTDTSKVLVTENKDSLLTEKIDSVKKDTITQTDTTRIEITRQENIIFKVQVGACHRKIPDAELHKRYPGNKEVIVELHEGWYKYLIGNFNKYSDAKQEKILSGTADAWVVVYRNNYRISITEVVNLLSYYPLSKLLIYMIT
jgi:hypothetical protein